jgi:putative hemolysin
MITILAIEGVALICLFVCSAFFSSAETAFFSLDTIQIHQIRRRRPASGKRIEHLLSTPSKLLSTILIGNTLVNVAAASLGYAITQYVVPDGYTEAVAIPAMVLLLVLFGEVAPKRFAIRRPEAMSIAYAPLLPTLITVFTPMRVLLDVVTHLFKKDIQTREDDSLTEDEFLTAVEVGEEEGVLDEDERDMVDGIIRLEDTQASDVMTPRVDLIGIDLEDDPTTYHAIVTGCSFRYLPVYNETLDNIEDLLDVSQYLLDDKLDFKAALMKPLYVPETAPLDTLLATFQREKRRVAVVADEYGGTAGLITRGDVLEEIIEYAGDEREEEKLTIENVGPDRWLIDGSTSLEEINYELDLDLEAEGADRIAGWVSAIAEHIPKPGEVVEAQGCSITVNRIRKNRITLVQLEKLPDDDDDPEDD